MRIFVFFFSATLSFAVHFNSYSQFTISGKVVDTNKEPLAGASVYVKDSFTGTFSNSEGDFVLKNIPEKEITLVASFLGFQTSESTYIMNQNVSDVQIILQTQTTYLREDVIISANKANRSTPIAFQDLDSAFLNANNTGVDLPIIMQNATSVVTTSDAGNGIGYTGLRIRGSDATRVNVTINGIPFNDPESQGTFFVNLPDITSSANSIQIQRGVGTSTNGAGAFGASVNINTSEISANPFGKYTFGIGSFNTLRNSLSFGTGIQKGFALEGRLSLISSDGYIDRATSNLSSYYINGGYFGKKLSVKFITFGGQERTYQSWYGAPKPYLDSLRTFNPYDYPDQVDDYRQTHYQMHLNYVVSNHWKLALSGFVITGNGYYEEYKGTDYNVLTGGSAEYLSDYGLAPVIIGGDTISQTNLVRRKWLDNVFGGAIFNETYHKNRVNLAFGGGYNQYDGNHFGEIVWAEFASNSQKNQRYYENKGLKTDGNIYGKISHQTTEKLNLFADIQWRVVNYSVIGVNDDQRMLEIEDNLSFFNPKAGLTYTMNNNDQFYASFAIAHHEPNRSDYVDAPSGKTPQPEILRDLEMGYHMSQNKWLFNGNVYYMDYTNQLVLTGAVNDVGAAIRQNVESSYRAGIELELGYKINSHWIWEANGTFSQNKIRNFTHFVDDWYNGGQSEYSLSNTDISFSPKVVAANTIHYKTSISKSDDLLQVSLISKYVGSQFFDNTQNELRKLDAYFTNDVRFIYQTKAWGLSDISINLTVRNVLNSLYISNAWAYTFEYSDNSWDPSTSDPYTQKTDQTGSYQMAGYFPQAGANFMLGVSVQF
jgi:iron complex outermembrane receptor protein